MSGRSTENSRSQNAAAPAEGAQFPWIAADLRPLAEPLERLSPNEKNARRHSDENVAAIAASLRQYGQRKPIVVNRAGGLIEAGNAVFLAAKQLGWTHVAVVWVEDDPAAAAGFALADNRTAELAAWNEAILAELILDLERDCPALHEALLLRDLRASVLDGLGPTDGLCDPDQVPEPPDEAITQPGDLWILGDHRLLCGDSSKAEDVDRLLDGATIHLVNTDPPYNVRVEPRSNNAIAAGLSSFDGRMSMEARLARQAVGSEAFKKLHNHQESDLSRRPEKAKPTGKKMRAKDRPLVNDFVSDEEFERLLAACRHASILVGHCRFATHGSPEDNRNNHPHQAGRGWLVHNGIVENYASLARAHRLRTKTQCDSEVLGLLMAQFKAPLALRASRTAELAVGRLAVLGIWPKPGRLLIVRNGNPLHFGAVPGGLYFASMPDALPGKPLPVRDRYAGVLRYEGKRLLHDAYAIE